MKLIASITILLMANATAAHAQLTTNEPKSLAEVARDSKKEKKDQAKIVLSDDTEQLHKPLIPDVFYGGIDNTDEILKAIDAYRSTHNLQETENVVHLWYDKHDAMLVHAIDGTGASSSENAIANWVIERWMRSRETRKNTWRCSA
jgi:hypothetical protein